MSKKHNWVVRAEADNRDGQKLYECSKCHKQELTPNQPSKKDCLVKTK